MKSLEFSLFKTKSPPGSPTFDLNDPKERRKYFDFKAGPEIAKIKQYLETGTFLAIMLAKKAAGKGVYTKLFIEALDTDRVVHLSAGDVVRDVHQLLETPEGKKELLMYLEKNYRGYISIEEGIQAILNRSTEKVSVPNEMMLALMKREIDIHPNKTLFLDGFPRTLDQISYSLFFRDLAGHRDDPDFFVLIDTPLNVIDERLKNRVVCPVCSHPFNTRFHPSSKIEYDQKTKKFHILCDNPECKDARTIIKEGDKLGIEAIKTRLEADGELMFKAFTLYGVPKILLRNTVPVQEADQSIDEYEMTSIYTFGWDEKEKKVTIDSRPWVVKDDQGRNCFVLSGPPIVVSLIKQLADLL